MLLIAIHGILTGQTDASWPSKLAAWVAQWAPQVKVLTEEYWAGPFPRWNCLVKDPLVARRLTARVEEILSSAESGGSPPIWLVAHSNGAVIALLVCKRLISRGHQVGGVILTGAACQAELRRNGVMEWWSGGVLGRADCVLRIPYCVT